MGESLHPDELKAKTTNDLRKVPTDFQDWGLLKIPPRMKLRNRLTPASLSSVPAISLSRTNTLTETMTETTLTFSSDDKFSDFNDSVEDVESGTTLSGVQIRTQQAIKNLQDRRNRRKRNIHSVFRRAPQFDGSLIRDDYDKTDELTEAPNLKTTEKGVKLVARTIIPLPPTRQPRFQLAPLDRGYSPPRHDANRRNKRRHLPPSDEEENDFDSISQIRTTSFRPGRLQQHQPQHSAAGPSPLSSLAYSGVPEISPLPSPAPSPRDHSPFQPVTAAPPVFTPSPVLKRPQAQQHISPDLSPILPPSTAPEPIPPSPLSSSQPLSAQPERPEPSSTNPSTTSMTATQTPPTRVPSSLKRTKFSDEKGLPIAEDNQGRKYRLTRSFGINPKAKRMVLSEQASSASGSGESGEPSQPSPDHPVPSKPPQITTRTGRVIKKPDMLGDWDMETSPPDAAQPFKQPKQPSRPVSILKKPSQKMTKESTSQTTIKEDVQSESQSEVTEPQDHTPLDQSTPLRTPDQKPKGFVLTSGASAFRNIAPHNTPVPVAPALKPTTEAEGEEDNSSFDHTAAQDLSGLPPSIYDTPDISLPPPRRLVPLVPQPGTQQSLKAQDQMKEFLQNQDTKANENALAEVAGVLSPLQHLLVPGLPFQQQQPPSPEQQNESSFYPNLSDIASTWTPRPPRLYPDLPDPPLANDADPSSRPQRQRHRVRTTRRPRMARQEDEAEMETDDPPEPQDQPLPRRSTRIRRKIQRYGYDEDDWG